MNVKKGLVVVGLISWFILVGYLFIFDWSFPGAYNLPPHTRLSFEYQGTMGLVKGMAGSYEAGRSITVFITDQDGLAYWDQTKEIPFSALWWTIGTEGTFDVNFPNWGHFYVVFCNTNDTAVYIEYVIKTKISWFGYGLFYGVLIGGSILFTYLVKKKYFSREAY